MATNLKNIFRQVILVLVLTFLPAVHGQEFAERLHQDWILQDAADPVRAFANSTDNADEVKIVQKVIAELTSSAEQWNVKIKELQSSNVAGNDPRWKRLYFDVCTERRKQRLQFVRQTYPALVYAKHDVLGGSHYSYTESPSDAQHRDRLIRSGGVILSLQIDPDGNVSEKTLVEAPKNGTLRDPDVSYDGKKIYFSMRNDMKEDDYHLYDYDLATGNVRQLTFGLGFADVEPCCLPNGDIVFASTRCMQIVDCWWTDVVNLYCCDQDGRFMRRLGFDQVHTNYPRVLPDGRILYTRWDYNDRGQIFPHGLFVMNYDGTGQTEYYGNNSWFPTSILHSRGIPKSGKVVAVASGHHTLQKGKLVILDRGKGTQENQGAQLIAPIRETTVEKIDAYGQDGDQFQYPLALDENNFIVAYTSNGSVPFGLYYMDVNNAKRELLAWDASTHCGQPVPLQEREVPMARATSVDYTKNSGMYYVQDVYFGPGLAGVERGTIKELRIVALHFRAAGIGRNGSDGPAGGALSSSPISINNGSWDVKQVLGTVPVEPDGSAFFEVPARTPVYFQLLNDRGETVQTMRSWSTLQPGEQQNCFGCHEEKGTTKNNPIVQGGSMRTLALRKAPRKPVPVKDVDPQTGFSYAKTIQPIFDKKCVSCHTGGKEEGNLQSFSLLGKEHVDKMAGRHFTESYLNLTQQGKPNSTVNWLNVQSIPPMLPPYNSGSCKSKLTTMFEEGNRSEAHKDVIIDDHERRLFALWIDLLVPFCESYMDANSWSPEQRAEYAYYQSKRDKMAALERENVERWQKYQSGELELLPPESFPQFNDGGLKKKKVFIETWLQKQTNSELRP